MNYNYDIADDICQPQNQDYDPVPVGLMDRFTIEELGNFTALFKILKQLEQKRIESSSPRLRSDQLRELNRAYNNKKLVLVLGAGISKGCGLDDWDTLLNKIRINMPLSDADHNCQALFFDKIFFKLFEKSNLILARNLHSHKYFGLNDNETMLYERFVRCVLYRGAKLKCSKTLREIIRLCSIEGGEKLLDSIITYNYDDILEHYLYEKNYTNFKSIYHIDETDIGKNDLSRVPIYHVHGFLPRNGNLTIKNKIILSENEYHILYNNESWNNKIQLDKFNNNKCLFLGLSLNDPNLRRLLDSARQDEKTFHYIIKLRPKLSNCSKKLKNYLKNNKNILDEKIKNELPFKETAMRLKQLDERFFEDDALSLGLQTIWAEHESDISIILQQIKKDIG